MACKGLSPSTGEVILSDAVVPMVCALITLLGKGGVEPHVSERIFLKEHPFFSLPCSTCICCLYDLPVSPFLFSFVFLVPVFQ